MAFETVLSSPDPAVVSTLSVGTVLTVQALDRPSRVVAQDAAGRTAGGIAARAADLVECIQSGNEYDATVLQVSGGVVRVKIENR